MGLFTTLAEMVVTGFGNPDSTQAKLANAVVKKFQTNDGAGLTAILQQLESKGLGQVVQSWVGTGPNQPISSEQIEKAARLRADSAARSAHRRLARRHPLASCRNPAENRRPPDARWKVASHR